MTKTNPRRPRNEATFTATGFNGSTTEYEVVEEGGAFTVTTFDHQDGVDPHSTRQTWSRRELDAWVAQLQQVLAASA